MRLTAIAGIVAILAGIAIILWPVLLNFVVAIALVIVGAFAAYTGFNRPGLVR